MICATCSHPRSKHTLSGVWIDLKRVLWLCQANGCRCMQTIDNKKVKMPEQWCTPANNKSSGGGQ